MVCRDGDGRGEGYVALRADFESSITCLGAIEVGVMGVEGLGTGYEGFDGVYRMSVREEAERRGRERKRQREQQQ